MSILSLIIMRAFACATIAISATYTITHVAALAQCGVSAPGGGLVDGQSQLQHDSCATECAQATFHGCHTSQRCYQCRYSLSGPNVEGD